MSRKNFMSFCIPYIIKYKVQHLNNLQVFTVVVELINKTDYIRRKEKQDGKTNRILAECSTHKT